MSIYTGVIYCYTNEINGKKYIGKTVNEKERILRHRREACKCNRNTFFYNAIRKHGWENFNYSVLCRITTIDKNFLDKKLLQAEVFIIKLFNTNHVGYNMTEGGEGVSGRVVTEEFKCKMKASYVKEKHPMFGKKSRHSKKVLKLNFSGEILDEYNSIREAGVANGVSPKNISACCNLVKYSLKGFVYRFKENFNPSINLLSLFKENKIYKYRQADRKRFEEEIRNNAKKCTSCGKTLPITDFRPNPRDRTIFLASCKKCQLDYQRKYNLNKKQVSAIPR